MKILEKCNKKQNDLYGAPSVTIVFLGDSVTQGCFECYKKGESIDTIFDAASAYSARFKNMLNTLYPKVQINVIDSGISGDSASGGIKRFERDVARFSPDLVVIGYALNDSTCGKGYADEYENNMRELVFRVKKLGSECVLLTPNAMCTGTSPHLTEFMKGHAVNLAKFQNDGTLDEFVERIRKIGKSEGVPVCDVYAEWKNMLAAGVDVTELLANKLNHPTREMHYFTAFMLLKTILDN